MLILKQSTAIDIRMGPFVASNDGVTERTSLTIAQADRRLSKDGGAFAQTGNTSNATHDSDGWYSFALNTADTDTVGELIINIHAATALPLWRRYYVLEEAIYDALFESAATGFDSSGRVDVGSWLGTGVFSGTGGPDVNVNAISDSTSAAEKASAAYAAMQSYLIIAGSTTTAIDVFAPGTSNDLYIGRLAVFYDGAAQGEVREITDWDGTASTLTVSPALENTPAGGDNLIIV